MLNRGKALQMRIKKVFYFVLVFFVYCIVCYNDSVLYSNCLMLKKYTNQIQTIDRIVCKKHHSSGCLKFAICVVFLIKIIVVFYKIPVLMQYGLSVLRKLFGKHPLFQSNFRTIPEQYPSKRLLCLVFIGLEGGWTVLRLLFIKKSSSF